MLVFAAIAAGGSLAGLLVPVFFDPLDFIAFWSSAHVFVAGQNPYDPAQLLPLQHAAGSEHRVATTMFNPPWTLPLLAPLAALPVQAAFAVWVGLQFALVVVSAVWLWSASEGRPDTRWVGAGLAVAFTPTFLLLCSGQLDALVLFGLAGFLHFHMAGRPAIAGCLGALTAIKPHLFGLFAVALAIDAVRSWGGRRVVVSGTGTLVVLSAVALAVNPHVFGQFAAALSAPSSGISQGVKDYPAPVIGVMLRDELPGRPTAAQFAPLALATVALVLCARRLPTGDRWVGALPWLVAGSLVVAPYGGWWYDMVLLLPLVLLTAIRLGESGSTGPIRAGLVAFGAFNIWVSAMFVAWEQLSPLFVLVPPVAALGCFALIRSARPRPA